MEAPADATDGTVKDGKKTGRPSLPDYIDRENLAIAMAAQKTSMKPDQPLPDLEAGTQKLYPQMLRNVVEVHGWPTVWWKAKNGGAGGEFTVDDSIEQRISHTKMWTRYTDAIKRPCNNVMSPALYHYYNTSGEVPSGTLRDNAIAIVKEAVWKEKQGATVDLATLFTLFVSTSS